jgi:hypothetical protein
MGIDQSMAKAMGASALGDTGAMHRAFATRGEMQGAFRGGRIVEGVSGYTAAAANLAGDLMGGRGRLFGGYEASGSIDSGGWTRDKAVAAMKAQVGELAESISPEKVMPTLGGKEDLKLSDISFSLWGKGTIMGGLDQSDANYKQTQNKLLDVFKGPEGSDFKEALTYFSNGAIPKSKGGNPGDTAIGIAKLEEMAHKADVRGDKESAALYREMQKEKHHTHLAKMGDTQRQLNSADSIGTIKERMERARKGIGLPNVQSVMDQVDTISAKGSKEGLGLGKIMMNLLTGSGGAQESIESYQDALKKLTQTAEGADPIQLMALIAKTQGMPGMSGITEALQGAADIQGLGEAKGKGAGRQADALSKISGKMGFGTFINNKQLVTLQSHPHGRKQEAEKEKVEADLLTSLKLLDPAQQKFFKEMIKDIKGGDNLGLHGLAEQATAVAAARAHSDPAMDSLARFKKEMSKDIIGKLGSSEGMHAELQQHTVLLRELVSLGHGTDHTTTGNPQHKPGTGHEDEGKLSSVMDN